ncbi:hypothetical protein HDF16_005389 [Granulicella aggregans]|uniref:Uncharacterized protein n=1 Tax=Granulicella aggregans TaxID=474949 RepID=A0A7W7ZIT4_9BACT|nr:hypothetical protein [Granulicella aggregans]MBB5060653.1 hypothetical protein [Granulicella aggregans]
MKYSITIRIAIVALWLNVPGLIHAQIARLDLKHGTYVNASISCTASPFAAMRSWDGIGFSGPHSSRCMSRVLGHKGNHFKISTSCSAVGDGTPSPAGQIDIEKLSLIRLSNVDFVVSEGAKPKTTYRWCTANTGLGNFKGSK